MNAGIGLFVLSTLLISSSYCPGQIKIPKTSNPPEIDGRVNDESWESAALIDEFFQREPHEGKTLTERTEIFIAYDTDHIYFGIKCYQDPKSIAAKEMLRGASLPHDDRVHIILDTYQDGRNGFFFEINPLGSIGDGLVSENGREVNRNWEGLFTGKSSITTEGWEAELAIPFKTLSFDPKLESWGLFMNRMIESKQEWGSWPVANINMPEAAMSDAGIISGLQGISQGIGLDIAPYALTGFNSKSGESTDYKINAGGDIYYQVTPSLKASLSINTDFAEAEADTRQINLSRFSIRLREKRNFFLDGASLLAFGLEGRRTEPPSGKLSPFFSRRMGIDPQGFPIPINYGARITGRIEKWNVGMMHINERVELGNKNATVARISRNIGQLSSVGMITTIGNSISEVKNVVAGLDLNLASSTFRGNKTIAFMLYGLKSNTEHLHGNDISWGALLTYPNDLVDFRLGHQQIGENFFAGLGFVPRNNIREYWGELTLGPRINILGIRQYSFGGGFDYVTNFDNTMQSQSFSIKPAGIRFNSGDELDYELVYKYEFLVNHFNIYADYIIPAGVYTWWENQVELETSGSRNLQGGIEFTTGSFFTGRKNSIELSCNWKIFVHAFIGTNISRDYVSLPEGNFKADIFQFNLNLLFSPNLTLYNYLQYDSQSNNAGLQTRFRWILKPGNEILLVWNSGYILPENRFMMVENALRLKLKYNIRF